MSFVNKKAQIAAPHGSAVSLLSKSFAVKDGNRAAMSTVDQSSIRGLNTA